LTLFRAVFSGRTFFHGGATYGTRVVDQRIRTDLANRVI
jgi:hypothetical protein